MRNLISARTWSAGERNAATSDEVRLDWERIARVQTHPLQVAVLRLMTEMPPDEWGWSPTMLADRLGEKLPNIAYHVRRLVDVGLLELADTRPRGGAIEHLYRLAP